VAAANKAEKFVDVTLPLLVVTFVLARVAGTALLWVARPAAGAKLPSLTSLRAILELAVGVIAALWTGWHAPVLLAALVVVVRASLEVSYRLWGGIQQSSLLWVRLLMAASALFIARLPGSSLYSFVR